MNAQTPGRPEQSSPHFNPPDPAGVQSHAAPPPGASFTRPQGPKPTPKRPGLLIVAVVALGLVSANFLGVAVLQFITMSQFRGVEHSPGLLPTLTFLLMAVVTLAAGVVAFLGVDFGRLIGAGAAGALMLNSALRVVNMAWMIGDFNVTGASIWVEIIWALGGLVLGAAAMLLLALPQVGDWFAEKRRRATPADADGQPPPPTPNSPQQTYY